MVALTKFKWQVRFWNRHANNRYFDIVKKTNLLVTVCIQYYSDWQVSETLFKTIFSHRVGFLAWFYPKRSVLAKIFLLWVLIEMLNGKQEKKGKA